MAEAIQLPHLPSDIVLYISLYRSLQNADFLRQQLLAGNREFEYAFIDASLIVSRSHLLAACFRALNDHLSGRMKSKNVHSEIVFCLSGNNNIGEAFSRFGIQPSSTTDLVAVKVSTGDRTVTQEEVRSHLDSCVRGSLVPLTDDHLSRTCDWARVRKVYKIAAAAKKKEEEQEEEEEEGGGRERRRVERAVLGAMALRGAT